MLDFLKYPQHRARRARRHDDPRRRRPARVTLYLDPQINSRLERLTLGAYPLATEGDRRTWQRFLKDAEAVLPLLRLRPTGVFGVQHAGHIWRRTRAT